MQGVSSCQSTIRTAFRTTSISARTARCSARWSIGSRIFSIGGRSWARRTSRPPTSICAPRPRSTPRAGRPTASSACRNIAGASSSPIAIPTAASASATSYGQDAWQQIPGEYRATLRRLIVTQGDTEPASVEQQRLLGHTAPSLYDLRNLFQVNVEEGRHLWAMVYLLHAYFGRDGREEAEELLERHSGDADKPRILGTFNEPIRDWLCFFMFTYFTDRDGKFQLKSLAESSFDPLARTCSFMLTEEAHHMFVGDTGISRVVKRTLEVMKELNTEDPAAIRHAGAIDLPTVQRYLNFWFSSSLDLFGAEISSNAASYFANGLKGRPDEAHYEDHVAAEQMYTLEIPDGKGGVEDRADAACATR